MKTWSSQYIDPLDKPSSPYTLEEWLYDMTDEKFLEMVNSELDADQIEEHKTELLQIKNEYYCTNSVLKNYLRDCIIRHAFNDGVRC